MTACRQYSMIKIVKGVVKMIRIKGATSVEEFKKMRDERIQQWIDDNFEKGCVTWKHVNSQEIKITDMTGDSMIINLDNMY